MPQDYDRKASIEEARVNNTIERIKERLSHPITDQEHLLAILEAEVSSLKSEIAQFRVGDEIVFS